MSDEACSLISSDAERQAEVFDFITQSFYASPADINELEAAVLLASDNSSPSPGADRCFLKGVFAYIRYLSAEKPERREEEVI